MEFPFMKLSYWWREHIYEWLDLADFASLLATCRAINEEGNTNAHWQRQVMKLFDLTEEECAKWNREHIVWRDYLREKRAFYLGKPLTCHKAPNPLLEWIDERAEASGSGDEIDYYTVDMDNERVLRRLCVWKPSIESMIWSTAPTKPLQAHFAADSTTVDTITFRQKHTQHMFEDCLYAVGGEKNSFNPSNGIDSVDVLNVHTGERLSIKFPSSMRLLTRHCSFIDEKAARLYVWGGYSEYEVYHDFDLAYLDLRTHRWTMASIDGEKPKPRASAAGVFDEEKRTFYMWGGRRASKIYNDLWRFDVADMKWTQCVTDRERNFQMYHKAMSDREFDENTGVARAWLNNVMRDKACTCDACEEARTRPHSHYRGGLSHTGCPLPRTCPSMVMVGRRLVLFGGGVWEKPKGWTHHYRDFYFYHVDANEWERVDIRGALPCTSSNVCLLAYGHHLLLNGGGEMKSEDQLPGHGQVLAESLLIDTVLKVSFRPTEVAFARGAFWGGPRDGHSATLVGNSFVFVGSYTDHLHCLQVPTIE